ncbi:MAG: hypothetical protein GY757_25985 [bacterium]|nr:hypothetical protein [bacterium]
MAVRTLSLEYYLNRDWQGIIEFYRLLAVKNKYEPGTDDYIDLGEAYWQYAKELGAGPPGKWAANQSLKYYYRASGGEHLERYTTPFNENKKGEVNR